MLVATLKRFLRPAKPHIRRGFGRLTYLYDRLTRRIKYTSEAQVNDRPRILVCDETEPAWDQHAGGARMAIIVDILRAIGSVTFCPLRQHDERRYSERLISGGIRLIKFNKLRTEISRSDFDVAIVSRAEVAGEVLRIIPTYSPRTKMVFDTVDIASVRSQREYEVTGDRRWLAVAQRVADLEHQASGLADEVWCVTDADAEVIRERVSDARLRIVPTIHDTRKTAVPPFSERAGLAFVGSAHRPNLDAVGSFCRDVMPILRQKASGLTFNIAGSMQQDAIREHESPDVRFIGFVPDLGAFLDQHRVFVCPVRYGSGMKGKIGEAMAAGLPVVTTSIGAEGMGLEHGRTALIADSPSELADLIVEVYTNEELWTAISSQGLRHVEDRYSSAVVEREIRRMFDELGVTTR